MASLYDWSLTAADNATADSEINFEEFQNPDTVNDSARKLMSRVAEWRRDLGGSITTGGTGNAYTVTINSPVGATYPDGLTIWAMVDRANSGASTLSVTSGATTGPTVPIRAKSGTVLPNNSILANNIYAFRYRSASNEFIVSGSNAGFHELAPSLLSASVFGLRVGDPIISFNPTPNPGFVRLTETTQSLLKATYPDLNAWASGIGYPWGSAATTFNLPPAAGYFLRFAATTSAIDPSGARALGSIQSDGIKTHTHGGTTGNESNTHTHTENGQVSDTTFPFEGGGGNPLYGQSLKADGTTSANNTNHTHDFTTSSMVDGITETRPKNVAFALDIMAVPALVANGLIGAVGYSYRISTATTAADPGTGYLRLNNAAAASATALYISETDVMSTDLSGALATWTSSTSLIKGRLRILKVGTPATFAEFDLTARTDNGAWDTFAATYRAGPGGFTDGDQVHVQFLPKGDAGGGGGGGEWGEITGTLSAQTDLQAELTAINAVAVAAAAQITAHEAASDPHPGYLTPAEGNAVYVRSVNGTGPDGSGNVTVSGGGGGSWGSITGTLSSQSDLQAALNLKPSIVTTRTALKALDTTAITAVILTEAGREGVFLWKSGNYSTQIAADTQEGVYVKATAIASSAGSWVRVYDDAMAVTWFGAAGDGSTDDTTALQAAINAAKTAGAGLHLRPGVFNYTTLTFDSSTGFYLFGHGAIGNSVLRCVSVSSTAGIKVRSAFDFTAEFITFDHSSASFSGYLVDLRHAPASSIDTQGALFRRCTFASESYNKYSAIGLMLDQCSGASFEDCKFGGLSRPVDGQQSGGGGYANCIRFSRCNFADNTGYCFNHLGENWVIEACNFQACHDGAQRIAYSETAWRNVSFIGCSVYDATAGGTNLLYLGAGSNLTIVNGQWGGRNDLSATNLINGVGAIIGLTVTGAWLSLFANVAIAAAGSKAWSLNGNYHQSCSTFVSGVANIDELNILGNYPSTSGWTDYTPTMTPGSGSFTSATASGRYTIVGRTVTVKLTVTITTNGTAAGSITLTAPKGPAITRMTGTGIRNGTGGALLPFTTDGSSDITLIMSGGGYPGADSETLHATLVYEV